MIDPVTLAIIDGRLVQLADEMDATLYRSAFNPIIAEARDACHGLYDAKTGDTLVQGASGLPIFVGAMAFGVRAVIEKVKKEGGLQAGDCFIFNDPTIGGTHLNDFRLVRPVFRSNKLFCWIASAGHWLDIGGNVPGGYNPSATESFQEGVCIPPVKLVRAGVMNTDLLTILAANSRVPNSNWGDLNAQIGALDLGEGRLHGLLDEYGDETIGAAFEIFSNRAEAIMRAAIAKLPDGKYNFADVLDNDGITAEKIDIKLDISISGDEMELDVALKHIFTEVPANAGCLRPIKFIVPASTILAAAAPRPMAGYTETILRLIGVIMGGLAKADPARATAAPFGTINALSMSGTRADGARWVMFSFFGGGLGGNPESDGLNHANNPISTATIPPIEILEAVYPVLFRQWALRPNSAGAGEHRGGLGAIYEVETLTDTKVSLLGDRGTVAPFGVAGGGAAALNLFSWDAGHGVQTAPLVSKVTDVFLPAGCRLRLETPGGGGWGNPAARTAQAAARDLALGYVTK
jgi:N-methylhydantoinase B